MSSITALLAALRRRLRGDATPAALPPDIDAQARDIIAAVRPYTMTSPERLFASIEAARYAVAAGIPGDIVECGVWRGGSMMAAALALKTRGDTSRELYLFDTFEGMSAPTDKDVAIDGKTASELLETPRSTASDSPWCYAGLDDVRANLLSTGYPAERIHFVQGKVEDTLPARAPQSIAVLRLDTDWYESTRHELEHLYPRLSPGGVLIIDDYGHWEGCRKAVDEYFAQKGIPLLLARIDYTGRMALKPR